MIALDLEGLLRRSEIIVHGTCSDLQSFLGPDQRIHTRYTFRVHRTLKGTVTGRLVVVHPGGTYRGVRTLIAGLSSHRIGDETILFLGPATPGTEVRLPVGLDQGVFRVEPDGSGGARVTRRLTGLRRVDSRGNPARKLAPEEAGLEEFLESVKHALTRHGVSKKK